VWKRQFCAGEHEANLRLSSTNIICIDTQVLNTYSPTMSYLAPSTSSFQSTERISQGAVSSESQLQKYASLSSYACQRVNKHGQRATVHIRHRSTSLTMFQFSTSFISIGHSFWVKTRMTTSVSRGEENGLGNAGGIDSPTFVKDGGTSYSGQHPTWASALCVHMARL
jgi:hypothetical protein